MARRLDEIQERAGADRHSTRDSFPESAKSSAGLSTTDRPIRAGGLESVREAKAIATECVHLAKLTGDEDSLPRPNIKRNICSRGHNKRTIEMEIESQAALPRLLD